MYLHNFLTFGAVMMHCLPLTCNSPADSAFHRFSTGKEVDKLKIC
ncbi:hypothetical protein RUMCAL_02957 [Ruminococcus callidus ATCC 27760]|uniref:Uncharacterized protein n=1 Tax=Ruminococcus callidus ATCC 27760 TaxID=411473 RepID=U2LIN6_9FIRM|nr:hypothetical protein RUMCAL_02957 [Ruminococcus callidus ATCC 27760]